MSENYYWDYKLDEECIEYSEEREDLEVSGT